MSVGDPLGDPLRFESGPRTSRASAHDIEIVLRKAGTMTNPFAQGQQPPAQDNPYAQPPAQDNPYAQPTQQQNPYAQPAAAPQAYAPPVAPQQAPQYGAQGQPAWLASPVAVTSHTAGPPAVTPSGPPPALSATGINAAPPPPPSGDGKGAKFAHMYGRLLLIFPLALARQARNPKYVTPEQRARGDLEQDRLVATVVVLDDGRGGMGPIWFGGDPQAFPAIPDTESAPLPYLRKAMWITQSKVVEQLRGFVSAPGTTPNMVCGRILKEGQERNAPWFLQDARPEELTLAGQYLEAVGRGLYPHPLA